jgi:hypothetical protein
VRKCEELYDVSHRKYSDSVWKEILWGQTGEELKRKAVLFFFISFSIF